MIIKFFKILLGSFLIINHINAQLCQGSLGDPIISITFGQGSNPGGSLSAATTSYQYVTSDCPADGYYTVRNNTSGCFGNTWHTLNSDHTGDSSGYFMLVNASFQPSAFYQDTVKGLCGNTTYQFAAWVMNVLLPASCNGSAIQPDLTFSIERTDGTLLQSSNTNNIPSSSSPTWKQYGFFFTTPPSVSSIVLRIVNNAPGGCGNDLALDDITFRPCGPQITGSIDGQPVATIAFCKGLQQSFVLNCTTSGGFLNPAFQWQNRNPINNIWFDIPMANNNTFVNTFAQNTPSGIYQLRLAIAESGNLNSFQCRVYSQPFTFTINPEPVADAGPDKIIFKGQSVQLSGSVNSQGNFAWSPAVNIDDIHSLQPIVNPPADRNYILNLVSGFGCGTSSDTVFIKVFNGIFVPNAFSPNGDKINDSWNIPGLGACPFFEVTVYNRFGQLVFQTKDKLKDWDGTSKGRPLPIGIYVYLIKTCNSPDVLKGTVLLLR